MTPEDTAPQADSVRLAGEIVAAYISNNSVPVAELPGLIRTMHDTIAKIASGTAPGATESQPEVVRPSPAQIRKSVQQDGLTSFVDGKTYKTLKRHLTANGLTPQEYRERYGLPSDYPMVAPSYAEQRSALAKAIGLGQPGSMTKPHGKARRAA
jgi:predicted transcriptional regulator